MRIIILGAGQIGGSLAEILVIDGHDVTLVDTNKERLNQLQDWIDVSVVHGFCSYPSVLAKAGADEADMVVAVSSNDEANILACQIASMEFNVKTKMARVRSPNYFKDGCFLGQEDFPIDKFISPERLVTEQVTRLIEYPGTTQVLDFFQEKTKMVSARVRCDQAVGQTAKQLFEGFSTDAARFLAIHRSSDVICSEEEEIQKDDEVFFVAASGLVKKVVKVFSGSQKPFQQVMIAGGGNIGKRVAQNIEKTNKTKIVEIDRQRCEEISRKLLDATVLHGDVTDKNLLTNEDIEDMDLFFAVTNNDETNILSALLAKRLGCQHVMAIVTRSAYVDLIEGKSINVVISPQQATLSSILAEVRHSRVQCVYSLLQGNAEIFEVAADEVEKVFNVVGKTIETIEGLSGLVVGALMSEGELVDVTGDVIIKTGDSMVLFVGKRENVNHINKSFQENKSLF